MFLPLKTEFWALIPSQFIIHIISFYWSCIMKYVLCEHFVVLNKTLWINLFLCSQLYHTKSYQRFYCRSNLFQYLATDCKNIFSLCFFYFFLCHNLWPLPLLFLLCISEKSWPPASLYHPIRYWKIAIRSPSNLLQVNQTHFPQPLLVCRMLQHHNHHAGLPLDPLQVADAFPVLSGWHKTGHSISDMA